ncbi:MAG TPA: helix-turn-helix transcriptional regulator [Vicinamibacterales bacterium]|nr:helix-turn-helix transcriptional regulator [Vicinamibacterales bacterium]
MTSTVIAAQARTFHDHVKCRRSLRLYTQNMFGKYPLAEVGALLAEPSRVAMLTVVLDGRRHSAGELAMAAGLSPQAASAHLAKLTNGGLLKVVRLGRRRLFALARPEVGHALESLGAMARTGTPSRSAAKADTPMRFARTCYDHLAGQVAVGVAQALVRQGVLRPRGDEYQVLSAGVRWFDDCNIDFAMIRAGRRKLTRQCLDWTEREPHIGGALGAALLGRCLSAGWIARIPNTRAVRITDSGSRAFRDLMGFDPLSLRNGPPGTAA